MRIKNYFVVRDKVVRLKTQLIKPQIWYLKIQNGQIYMSSELKVYFLVYFNLNEDVFYG